MAGCWQAVYFGLRGGVKALIVHLEFADRLVNCWLNIEKSKMRWKFQFAIYNSRLAYSSRVRQAFLR